MNTIELVPLEKPVTATVSIPGSKSYTNRALILAAMTEGPVEILNPLTSDDTRAMIECLKTLGIEIEEHPDKIVVKGSVHDIQDKEYTLNAHLSGTTIRFLLALCTVIPGTQLLTGDEGLNKRPIGPLVDALRELGADIEYVEKEGFPPMKITSSTLKKHEVSMRGDISSQYFSALLMISPLIARHPRVHGDPEDMNNKTSFTLHVIGDQISKPYIDMTIASMQAFSVPVKNESYASYKVLLPQSYSSSSYTVEGDFSSAGYFLAIAALTHSTITLNNLNPQSAQADRKLIDVLTAMGSTITSTPNAITIHGNGVKPMDIDMIAFPDQAQTVAVLAAFAKGKTILRGVQSLRVKETERVVAVQQELAKMNIQTEATHDTLTIYGGDPKPATIATYGDHRMAMSFAVAGTKLPRMNIENPEVVTKTFPEFWEKLKEIGVKVS